MGAVNVMDVGVMGDGVGAVDVMGDGVVTEWCRSEGFGVMSVGVGAVDVMDDRVPD